MGTVRVQRTVPVTLSRTFYVDETATDVTGDLTVTVTRVATGATVTTGTATSAGADTGTYTFTLPAQADLDWLTVTWAGDIDGSTVTLTDQVEIVGGFLFELAEARASDTSLGDTNRYPTTALADKRIDVEDECRRITGRSFTPRYTILHASGAGSPDLLLPTTDIQGMPVNDVRRVRAVSTQIYPGLPTVWTAGQLATVRMAVPGVLSLVDGSWWPVGLDNIVVELEYGWDAPPADLAETAMYRLRSRLNLTRSGVPDRARVITTPDGGSYSLTMPGPRSTGIPEVDAVYQAYAVISAGLA